MHRETVVLLPCAKHFVLTHAFVVLRIAQGGDRYLDVMFFRNYADTNVQPEV